jgi:ABC-type multidrug transport system fused ATPase/permease subunit
LGALNIFSGYLNGIGNLSVFSFIISFYVIFFTTTEVGLTISMIPDITTSLTAAKHLFGYLDEPNYLTEESEEDLNNMIMKTEEASPNKEYEICLPLESPKQTRLDTELIETNAFCSPHSSRTKFEGRIEFKNVDFTYPARNKQILSDLSFVIEPGQNVGFVGISGSGKSTIIQLLLRFYEINSGEILVDGVNIKNYKLKDLRNLFGVVFQEPVLFEGTIEENIK